MRFLLDQDVYAVTRRLLRDLGHDVVTAAERNLSRSPDSGLLMRAADEKRLFVTRDKDFGGLVFVERLSKGVIYLRISPETLAATHEEFKRVLSTYSEPGRFRLLRCRFRGPSFAKDAMEDRQSLGFRGGGEFGPPSPSLWRAGRPPSRSAMEDRHPAEKH